jgi:outer membrane protein TolC
MRLNNPSVDLKVRLSSSTAPAPAIKVNQAAYAMVNASVPLFSGMKIHYGIESAKYLEQATKLDAENQKEEVVENAINAYCNLYKAQKAVELVKQNLEQQAQRVTDFTNLEKNGILPFNDLLKAQLQQSNTELALLDAENNLKITMINLSLMLGLPENTDIVSDSNAFQNIEDIGLVANWEQVAFENRKDMASLSFQEKATATSIKSAKGDYFPGLAITGGYIAADIPNLLTVTNALNVGLGLQYNIGSIWKTGAKIDAAKAHLTEVQATRGIMADQVRLEINQAYENYLLSMRKIDVYQKAIEQAKENYRISKNKFDNHLMTISDMLDADVAQLQAQLNLTTSKADAFAAYKKLQHTAGVLVADKNQNTKQGKVN